MDAARGFEVSAMITDPSAFAGDYARRLASVLGDQDWTNVGRLAEELRACRDSGRHVFICGNGGSGRKAPPMANDLFYRKSQELGYGPPGTPLAPQSSVTTRLAD